MGTATELAAGLTGTGTELTEGAGLAALSELPPRAPAAELAVSPNAATSLPMVILLRRLVPEELGVAVVPTGMGPAF